VKVTDLGSSNGTRIDNRLAEEGAVLDPGAELRLGAVKAELEVIGAGDLETGVELPPAQVPRPVEPDGGEGPISTMGPAVLEVFALEQLPELVETVADGASRTEVAQAVGEALLGSMPCHRVEIVSEEGGEEGVLFSAERAAGDTTAPVEADAGEGYTLRVGFLSTKLADAYGPLVRAGAALVRAAGRPEEVVSTGPETPPEPPQQPRPPSVVPAVCEIYAQAGRVARGRVSILIRGESGTGKELLARFIHAASHRAGAPLVTINCAALPRDLLESELFGVERGVATGVEARPGKFEAAHGGTLFLDEIGDMAPETQARILRVLQEGEVYRLGGQATRPADVRVISATNRDIEAMVVDGSFRRDLYHRIADWVVELPPLRQRRGDVPNLAAHFLARACEERGIGAAGISRAAVDALVAYDWPGNVRQLEKEMGRAALFLEDGELLDTARLQPMIAGAETTPSSDAIKDVLERAEREHIQRVLDECGGVVVRASERLDMGLSTLYRRMKALGID
jgi:DNA-binding NtrC family response regulator